MRHSFTVAAVALAVALGGTSWAQTAIEIKKELLPKIKQAQAEGKDLGEAKKEYDEGDKNLRDGLQEEALAHFKKAKEAMPADAK